jgi:hypothetical protein
MRRTLKVALGLVLAAAAAGCQPTSEATYSDDAVGVEVAPTPPHAPAAPAAGETPAAPSGMTPPSPVTPVTPAAPTPQAARIAYVYRYGLELPVDQVPALMTRHEQACVTAGPAVCQVIGSETNRRGRDQLTAQLEIRATPAFITAFRARLGGDAEQAGGRVAQSTTESEDLTRSLVDTEARVRALATLRDRLQQLLATRSAPLDQLLATERELARVQGELDATRSALEVMRGRVATSRLTIQYAAMGRLAPDSAFRPVSAALSNALTVFMSGLAALILVFAGVLPVLLVGAPVVWLILRRRRARAQRLAASREAQSPPRAE